MKRRSDSRFQRASLKVFRALLRAFPVEFRWRFGRDMEEDFQDDLQANAGIRSGDRDQINSSLNLRGAPQGRERSQMMKLWIELIADVFKTAPREHLDILRQDVKYGLRLVRRDSLPTVIAILALAIGIGANTAIFSCVNAIIIRPLPYPESEKLVMPAYGYHELSPANFIDYRAQNQVFDGMAALDSWDANLMGVDPPQRLQGFLVSAEMFSILRIQPYRGRWFLPEEEEPGKDGVVMISYGLWERQFGSDPGILDRKITINGRDRVVVGIMPKGFTIYRPADLWAPLSFDARTRASRSGNFLDSVARLKPGVTIQKAQADITGIGARIQAAYPETNRNQRVTLVTLHDNLVGPAGPALWLLMGAVAFVLLIACANVANLMLARAATRRREVALRAALGARRTRLVRQLLTESLIVSIAGGAAGLLVAYSAVAAISGALPPQAMGFVGLAGIPIDRAVLTFTLLLSVLTGLLFGMVPAMQAASEHASESLKESGRSTGGGPGRRRVRGLLVVSEIAFSLVLLISSGLMVRSFVKLLKVDPGFKAANVLTMEMSLLPSRYKGPEKVVPFYRSALEAINSVPGVVGAGLTSNLPLGGSDQSDGFLVEGRPAPEPGEVPELHSRVVSPAYFRTMEITMLRGRAFSDQDNDKAPGVAVLNEAAAERLWPGEDPLGKRLATWNPPGTPTNPWLLVVGLVRNIHHQSLASAPEAEVYLPHAQDPYRGMTLVVRASGDPTSLIPGVRAAIAGLDKEQPIYNLQTLERVAGDSLLLNRFITVLLAIFAAIALIMAMIGVYGVISYGVTGRTREIGVRMALGASVGMVRGLVVREGLYLAIVGEALGTLAALTLSRLMSGLPFGVTSSDPIIFVVLPAALMGVVFLASYIPARRASRINPIQALRYE